MALKRYVNGAEGEFFFQKRAPDLEARLDRDGRAQLPVGPHRRGDRRPRCGAARLDREPRLHRPEPAPGPRGRPRPSRRAASRPRSGARASSGRRSATSRLVTNEVLEDFGSSAGRRRPARAGSTSTCGSNDAGRSPRCVGRRSRWRARSSGAPRSRDEPSGGRRSVTACSSTTTRTRRTAPSRRQYSVRPTPDARVSTPLRWDEVPGVRCEAFTIDTVPARVAELGDPSEGIDEAAGSLDWLLGARGAARGGRVRRRAVAAAVREAGG